MTLETRPLEILIVGAGLGGLTAALALRLNGHKVTLFESSHFSSEIGAAVSIGPNASGSLKRLGIDLNKAGSNVMNGFQVFDALSGDEEGHTDYTQMKAMYHNEWVLCHRGHLHQTIKEVALDPSTGGPTPQLHLATRIAHVDPNSAQITTDDGRVFTGDVIIGADGVHSKCRSAVQNVEKYAPFDSGHSGFRFLIPMDDLRNDPECSKIVRRPGTMSMVWGAQYRLICYPCVNNTIMNCMLMHPSKESDVIRAGNAGWSNAGSKDRMLEIANDLSPFAKSILRHAPDDDVKLYTLLDMATMPGWTCGKLALLGDAAHPFLPHQGQGAAQAFEDAISLGVMLSPGLSPDEIPARLKLYEEARMTRAHRIQEATRRSGPSKGGDAKSGHTDWQADSKYNYDHDERLRSEEVLQRHLHQEVLAQ